MADCGCNSSNPSGRESNFLAAECGVFKFRDAPRLNVDAPEPVFEVATQMAVLGGQQRRGLVEIAREAADHLRGQSGRRAEGHAARTHGMIENLARDSWRGRFVREHHVQAVGRELARRSGSLPSWQAEVAQIVVVEKLGCGKRFQFFERIVRVFVKGK